MRGIPRGRRWRATVLFGLVVAMALAGLVPAARADFPSPAPATTPVFASLDPDGGQYLTGGSQRPIVWNVTHDADGLLSTDLLYSLNGGANWTLIVSGSFPTGGAAYNWSIPMADTTTARVRVCVYPLDGHTACRDSAADFTIDSTAPYIVSVCPPDGAVNVPLDAAVCWVFSEPMNVSSVFFTMTPAIAFTATWSNNDTVVTLTHALPFAECTIYTIQVGGQDRAGWPLVAGPVPNPWSFTTVCTAPYIVSTDPAHGSVNMPLNAWIVAVFSEPMSTASVTWAVNPAIALTATWSNGDTMLTLMHAVDFTPCTVYSVWIDGMDLDGNPLVPGPVPNPWSFSTSCPGNTPPIVHVASPNGGESWDAGSVQTIVWDQSDAQDSALTIAAWLSTDGGATYPTVIFSGMTFPNGGNRSTSWTVPQIDTMTARVLVCAYDSGNLSTCDASDGDFTIRIPPPPPAIVATDPPHSSVNVPLDAPISVTFSEPIDSASLTVTLTPALAVTASWPTSTTVVLAHATPFSPCTAYAVAIDARDVDGNSLVPGPVPNPWSFMTVCPNPYVVLTSPPDGMTNVALDASIAVTFSEPMDSASLSVMFLAGSPMPFVPSWSSGNTTVTLGHAAPFSGNMLYRLRVLANSSGGQPLTAGPVPNPWAFVTCPCPPVITAATPGPGASHVPLDASIVVTFSEPMDGSSVTLTLVPAVAGLSSSWSAGNVVLTIAHATPFAPCTTYTVTVSGADPDGNPIVPGPVPNPWSFTTVCLPAVTFTSPLGGEDWTGGTTHDVSWAGSDGDDLTLDVGLYLSTDGGTTFAPVSPSSTYATGPSTLGWTLPIVDATDARLRIDVRDPDGNTASVVSSPFTIDSTPPTLVTSFPLEGSSGVAKTREMWFVFSELVDRASFENAFQIVPDPGGLAFAWSTIDLGGGRIGDVLTVDHSPFRSDADHVVTVTTVARDDSEPGNVLSAPILVRFRTQPPPPVTPPVAKAVGKNQVQEGEPVTFDGRSSTGNITDFTWQVRDNQDGVVAVLIGAVIEYTFARNGRYHVTLIVSDANGQFDDDTLEIAVTSNPTTLILAGAGGAVLAAALVGATEAGKYGIVSWLVVPLYSRRKRNEVLEHQTRGMIIGYVMVHPGDRYTDIKRNLVLTNSTLSYHLRVLEREGLVRSRTRGTHKHFYPVGARVPEDGGGLHEVQLRILGAVRELPGLAVADLAGALGITSQHALYHVRALSSQGLIRLDRRGFRLRCYPEERTAPTESGPDTP